jgi:hypothetical protein
MASYWLILWMLVTPALFTGCSEKPPPRREGEPTQADRERFSGRYRPPPEPPPSPALTPSTGDPDHDFLRRMSEHHAGLIVLTYAAIESNGSPSVQPAIRKIEEDHDHELDTMLGMLRRIYKDGYVPKAARDNTLTAETLRATGDGTSFFRSALQTEEQALQTVNATFPKQGTLRSSDSRTNSSATNLGKLPRSEKY